MAEEPQLRSETDSSSKRKLEEIQLAKQKAQEIVARLVNDAEAKRPRFDDAPASSDSAPSPNPESLINSYDFAQKSSQPVTYSKVGSVPFAATPGSYYGFQGSSKKMDIPNGKVGVVIGKGGETIKYLQLQSGAKIQVTRDSCADPYSQTREVELTGTSEQISRAEQLIKDVIAETDAGGNGSSVAQGYTSTQHGAEQFSMKVPNNKVALIIGKGGETIKNMQNRSGARIQIIPLHLPVGDTSTERTVYMNGTTEQIESAKQLINEVISENRLRNPPMSSNYMQHGYYPPGNWGPPGPPPMQQQSGYGYTQPGVYPTPPSYYGGFPPQTAAWDQASPSAAPVLPQQSSGYDYYGQQGYDQTGSASTNVSYGYDQGYSQQQQSSGQDGSSQGQHDQETPNTASEHGPPGAPVQAEGTATSQPYGTQTSTQLTPGHQVVYGQQTAAVPAGYTHQSYADPQPAHPGYVQMGFVPTGYGGQQAQVQLQTSQPVYGQGGFPPQTVSHGYVQGTNPQQTAPLESGHVQGTNPAETAAAAQSNHVLGTNPSSYGQPQPQVYGTERNGDGNVPAGSYGSAPATQEAVHPQR
eukprot:TRINITY_DN4713_c0_g2_i1.p1 TRINITY_DN4713_c0_g2~~TRINITY_DN4713_c0_g2_i1.p1  ORF type:complete len:583 (+),score=123.08 TRINITY_DN4713_c0_g2_i1:50-1798(+)